MSGMIFPARLGSIEGRVMSAPHGAPADRRRARIVTTLISAVALACLAGAAGYGPAWSADGPPQPLLAKGKPVDWWFVFKFNSTKTFEGCGTEAARRTRSCIFGGKVNTTGRVGQQYAVASSADETLQPGKDCLGATRVDPVGATFDQVYFGNFFYVIWNDQFYRDPEICGRSKSCGAPWGHSKGMLAWNDAGEGFVMQVTTPSWPGSGTSRIERSSGNTLGCVSTNNSLKASQHFFALKLSKEDLVKVLEALRNASVVTDTTKLQIVSNGGPPDIRARVLKLGKPLRKTEPVKITNDVLSSGVTLISKPSHLHVPPWQMISSILAGVPERAATWWNSPFIPSTNKSTKVGCWNADLLKEKPGPVRIALTGEWDGKVIKLNAPSNHAKIGVSTAGDERYVIFGDLNQQGTLSPPKCERSQNGRGGLFFVLKNKALFDSVSALIDGETAPTRIR